MGLFSYSLSEKIHYIFYNQLAGYITGTNV